MCNLLFDGKGVRYVCEVWISFLAELAGLSVISAGVLHAGCDHNQRAGGEEDAPARARQSGRRERRQRRASPLALIVRLVSNLGAAACSGFAVSVYLQLPKAAR